MMKNLFLKWLKKDSSINVIYRRISTYKQKNDLERQNDRIQVYCKNNNINISNIYSDISSGIDLDRNNLNKLINDVINLNIKNIADFTKIYIILPTACM